MNSPKIAWGVSEPQRRLAKHVAAGDVFLHYIDHAQAWAGYSIVSGALQENLRDSHADWLAALPYVIPIEPGIWLNEGQCEHALPATRFSGKQYHRQVSFTVIPATEAELIIKAVKDAATVHRAPSDEFRRRWRIGAESYYKGIVKGLAGGVCQLCGDNPASWALRTKLSMSEEELRAVHEGFLDAAHIVADCDMGPMTPDNLRALCPTCHRIVDRLPNERRESLLRNILASQATRRF